MYLYVHKTFVVFEVSLKCHIYISYCQCYFIYFSRI